MKLNLSEKDGNTYKVELDADKARMLIGKKIGDEVEGDLIGAPGYTFIVTGGSDISGFPMRADVPGAGKKMLLLSSGTGIRKTKKGERLRKPVRGNTVSDQIAQLNLVVKASGAQKLAELFPKPEKKEEKK
ncbi:MAG: 30S ribosomal protein S6e [Candidatus Micrarchaeota archaeon]|nr:30S ribosomal protein S6e [Candidatus Micrarchaeota archaeon]